MAQTQPTTDGVQKEYETKLLQYVQQLDHSEISDYSKGFSGTKLDTTIENSMAQLMRGGPVDDGDDAANPFRVKPCTCRMQDGAHATDCTGRWLRTLNKQKTCHLYVRTITHEVTGIKPSGFYDPEEERRQALLLAAGEYPHIRSCFLESLEETVRDVLKTHRQTPLLLTGSDEMSAELVAWFNQQVGVDRMKKPVPRGYVMDTRPLALGQTRTGVKFEDCVKTCKMCLLNSVKNGRFVVINIENKSPNFQDKVCGEPKYRDMFPMNVFDPKARGWRKEMLRFEPKSEDDAVLVLSTCTPGDYERELREVLDPLPWALLHPIHVQSTPLLVTTTTDLLQEVTDCFAQTRVPLVMDATENKDVVDLFWTVGVYGHSFVVDVPMAMYKMKGRTPTEDPETHGAILQQWRKSLVGAMKQGYYLVIKMGTETPDMRAFCVDDVFPFSVFQGGGEVQQQTIRERLYQPEDLEAGLPILRDGFGVVVTTAVAFDSFKRVLKASIPLRNMKGLVVM